MLGLWRYPWHCLYQTLDLTFSPNRKHVQTQGNIVPNAFMSSCWRTALCIILSEQPFQRHMIHNPVQTEAAHDCHLNIYLFYNLFLYLFLVKFQNLKYKLGRGVNHKNCLLRLALIDALKCLKTTICLLNVFVELCNYINLDKSTFIQGNSAFYLVTRRYVWRCGRRRMRLNSTWIKMFNVTSSANIWAQIKLWWLC